MSSFFSGLNPLRIVFDPIQIQINVQFVDSSPGVTPVTQADLDALEKRIMSQISDAIAAVKAGQDTTDASVDAEIARIQNAITTLTAQVAADDAKIADLQAKVDAGTATPADFQMLADITAQQAATKTKLDQVNPATATTLPPPGP